MTEIVVCGALGPVTERMRQVKVADGSPVKVNWVDVSEVAGGMAPGVGDAGIAVSTVQTVLEIGPALPAASTLRTSRVWVPSVRPVSGLTHGPHAPPSRRHSGVVPASPVVVKDAEVPVVEPVGRPLTAGAVVGAVASTVQATEALGPTLPAASARCTRTACPPSASPVSASGDVQAAKAAPSTEQA